MVTPMRLDFPGLLVEKLPSGGQRLRVRVEGDKRKRITLTVPQTHPAFSEHYHAARSGIQLPKPNDEPQGVRGSIGWLVSSFHKHMEIQVQAGALGASTQSYRVRHTNVLRANFGEFDVNMPSEKLIELRDTMLERPAAANTFIKSVGAMYDWAVERNYARSNPAKPIKKLHTRETGATPWTIADLEAYRKRHPLGTMAHLYLTLLTFSACRIGDAVHLGRSHEVRRSGDLWLCWQPAKKNSQPVEIPMAPQLLEATRAQTVLGPSYILTNKGKPFASEKALGNRFRKWCDQAGLEGLTSHGVRKAAGSLLAESGMSQHVIMSIHGHSEARTSEIYTKGANRRDLARQGMDALSKIQW